MNVDYDVFLAAVVTKAVEQAREFGTLQAVHDALAKAKADFLDNNLARLLLLNCEKLTIARVKEILTNGSSLLSNTDLGQVMGKAPRDTVAFFTPMAYSLSLGAGEVAGPFLVNGRPIRTGAYYVAMAGGHGVILLGATEDVARWADAVSRPPVSDAIAAICQEKIVELLAPSRSERNPLFLHLMKCAESQ
jgi:hypothetical protein